MSKMSRMSKMPNTKIELITSTTFYGPVVEEKVYYIDFYERKHTTNNKKFSESIKAVVENEWLDNKTILELVKKTTLKIAVVEKYVHSSKGLEKNKNKSHSVIFFHNLRSHYNDNIVLLYYEDQNQEQYRVDTRKYNEIREFVDDHTRFHSQLQLKPQFQLLRPSKPREYKFVDEIEDGECEGSRDCPFVL